MNLPNQLTVARFGMALAFVGLMSFHHVACHLAAYAVFTAAAITDYYDGKIARARNLVTNFGKLLDPIADKVLVIGAFIMLMNIPGLQIPGWTLVAIVAREFLVTGVRSLAASDGVVIGANTWGKTKAVVQMVYVFVFLALVILVELLDLAGLKMPDLLPVIHTVVAGASYWAIVFVAALTIVSGVQFIRLNWQSLGLGAHL